jgi:hypothetical protein
MIFVSFLLSLLAQKGQFALTEKKPAATCSLPGVAAGFEKLWCLKTQVNSTRRLQFAGPLFPLEKKR